MVDSLREAKKLLLELKQVHSLYRNFTFVLTAKIWNFGDWDWFKHKYTGHSTSVDTILSIDHSTIITGSSDGLIRYVLVVEIVTCM